VLRVMLGEGHPAVLKVLRCIVLKPEHVEGCAP
jgi:hypothetical protein